MNRNPRNGAALTFRAPEMLSHRNALNELDQAQRQMDGVFNAFFGPAQIARLLASQPSDTEFSPDIYEAKDELVVVMPIPGIEPGDLKIEATADTLSIQGVRKPFFTQENATQLRQSWWSSRQGEFNLAYTLPIEIDAERVQADYRNGVLELHLPKAQAALPKTIQVSVNSK